MAISALSRDPSRLRNSADTSGSPRSPRDRLAAAPVRPAPMRMCRVCRKRLPKAQLTRWVQDEAGNVCDTTQNLPGRGFYTCSDACASKLTTTIKPTKR
jgi:hypothetical protein